MHSRRAWPLKVLSGVISVLSIAASAWRELAPSAALSAARLPALGASDPRLLSEDRAARRWQRPAAVPSVPSWTSATASPLDLRLLDPAARTRPAEAFALTRPPMAGSQLLENRSDWSRP